jgi:hypothetical protein
VPFGNLLARRRVVHSPPAGAQVRKGKLLPSRRRRNRRLVAPLFAIVSGVLLVACTPAPLAQPSWPGPSDPMGLTADAGLTPTDREYLVTHTHSHLDVFVDGTRIVIPAGIGIDVGAEGVTETPTDDGTATEYGVAACDAPCISPLHTHIPDGILHTESDEPNQEPYTLGQFFTQWGLRLDENCVGEYCRDKTSIAVYLNGEQHEGDPAQIELTSHLEVAVVIGRPPVTIPSEHQFLTEH